MPETETNEQKLNRFFPFRGPCGMCGGPDARHRLWDCIQDRYGAAESIEELAKDYDLSTEAIETVLLRRRGTVCTMAYHGFPAEDGWKRLPRTYVLKDGEYEWNRLEEVPGEPVRLVSVAITNAEAFPPEKLVYLERRGDWLEGEDRWPMYYVWVRDPKPGEILSVEEMEVAKAADPKRKFLVSP